MNRTSLFILAAMSGAFILVLKQRERVLEIERRKTFILRRRVRALRAVIQAQRAEIGSLDD